MIYICETKCVWNERLWRPGDLFEGTEASEVPKHFVKYVDADPETQERVQIAPSSLTEAREVALLRSQCISAMIQFRNEWGKTELEKALGVEHGVSFVNEANRKMEISRLQKELSDRGIEYDGRMGPERLQKLLDGNEPIKTEVVKKHGRKRKKTKTSYGKGKAKTRGGDSLQKEGPQEGKAVDGQGGGEDGHWAVEGDAASH